jgi:hypothetical protein
MTFAGDGFLYDVGFAESSPIATTVDDSAAGQNCWTGWHVHENNSNDSQMYWDAWNGKWSTATTNWDGYRNDDLQNWIRRLHWVDVAGN